MPRSPEQVLRVRERSRENILDAALRLFARHGYAHTSVRMLADEAGISQGLLYNYFEGKHALLQAIFERSMEEVEADLAAAAQDGSPSQALERLVRSAFETLLANPEFWIITYQLRLQPDVLADLGEQVGAWAAQIVSEIERQLRRAGVTKPSAHARVLFAAIDGAAQHYVLDPSGYPLDAVCDALVALLVPRTPAAAAEGGRKESR